jgi:hypothetical protein
MLATPNLDQHDGIAQSKRFAGAACAPSIEAMHRIYPLAQKQESFASFLQKGRPFLPF